MAKTAPPAVAKKSTDGTSSMRLYVGISAVLIAVIALYELVPGADATAPAVVTANLPATTTLTPQTGQCTPEEAARGAALVWHDLVSEPTAHPALVQQMEEMKFRVAAAARYRRKCT